MLRIGHRGAPGNPRHGENTICSFWQALWKGADALEFDVRRCGSGELVVIHDCDTFRTTDIHGNVNEILFSELSRLDAGFGQQIPTLQSVLEQFGNRCLLNIELKEAGIADDVLSLIRQYSLAHGVIVSAFDHDDNDPDANSSWEDLKKFSRTICTAFLATKSKICRMGEMNFVNTALAQGALAVHPQDTATTPSLVSHAHKFGLLVFVWTVNDPREIARFKAMGVDGIFSDFPERL